MRLTDFCNRLPSRAPCGLLDSRLRSSSHRIAACGPRALRHEPSAGSSWAIGLAAARHGSPADPLSGCADQVELRLTANLLLQPSSQPSRDPRRVARSGAGPERPRERHGAVLAGPRSTAPPRHASRARCFRPCAEPATMPLTPSVATLREFPSRRTAGPGRPRRLVKDDSSRRARAPSIERVLSPPGARLAFASACVGSRRARHRCRCSRARGCRHCDPASDAFSPLEPSRVVFARWQVARPMALLGLDRAPLVDFCNQGSPRAHPWNRPIFALLGTRACARRPRYRETVWPPSRSAEAEPDGNHHPGERMAPSLQLDRPEVSRSHPAKSPAPAEVSRARGWHAWLPAASLDHPRAVSCALHPCGRPGDAATPTRSTRTPLVMRPLQCRLETPTLPDVTGGKPPNRRGPVSWV